MKLVMIPARNFVMLMMLSAAAGAQPVVAPSDETVGPVRGTDWGNYNIVNSFETGYRFHQVVGNGSKYRSDVNFGNGVRLLAGYLTVHSKNGRGRVLDEATLTTQGLAGDPYQSTILRIHKNRAYEYNFSWRLNEYFNPGLTTGGGNGIHLLDTRYDLQDHDLTIFPESKIKFFLGYTRGGQTGAGISTIQLFDGHRGDNFPLFTNVRRYRNEYRIGNEVNFSGIRLNWMHGWEGFKEDSEFQSDQFNPGRNPADGSTLNNFQRVEPYHGTSPYWRVGLFHDDKRFNINGRFTYTSGQRSFFLDETAIGTNRLSAAANRQVVSAGDARRPVATGNLTVGLSLSDKVTFVNHTSVYNVRTEGDSTFAQFDNASQTGTSIDFRHLGIRTIANEAMLNVQIDQRFGLFGGYNYSDRRISAVQQNATSGPANSRSHEQTNLLHSGVFGIRLRPAKPLTISVDGEVGRTNQPFSPVSERNYHAVAGRVQYKWKSLLLSAWSSIDYNINSVTLSVFSSRRRSYSATASWAPRDWVAFDASYSKNHLDTLGGIAYFANAQFIRGDQSYYVSNIHAGNIGVRFALRKYANLYFGYSRVQDVGDGRSNPLESNVPTSVPAFQIAQTFPLKFESPLARLSLRITEKLRWNIGYQYYGYHEDFFFRENYHAHTGYSSVLWSF